MKTPFFSFILVFIFSLTIFAQPADFTDASDRSADSTVFAEIFTHPDVFLSPLPGKVNENSGIIFYQDKIWTHNDSGGEPEIYAIDTASGEIKQTILLLNARNNDWEDITQDDDYIYVGDFGNNRGTRTDLKIYKIEKSKIPESGDFALDDYQIIRFSYADQEIINKKTDPHNFDCEAMISSGESLFLFSKNWGDQKTRVYKVPKSEGEYVVEPVLNFEANGLITAAALSPDGKQLALLGYIDYESFMWLFWDFDDAGFFSGKRLRVNFPDMVFVQTEGIFILPNNDILFSCEESSEFPSLFSVNSKELKDMAISQLVDFVSDKIILSGMPPEVSNRIKVDVLDVPDASVDFELRNQRWEKLFSGRGVMKPDHSKMQISIKTKDLEDGLYFLKVESGGYSLIRKVRVKH